MRVLVSHLPFDNTTILFPAQAQHGSNSVIGWMTVPGTDGSTTQRLQPGPEDMSIANPCLPNFALITHPSSMIFHNGGAEASNFPQATMMGQSVIVESSPGNTADGLPRPKDKMAPSPSHHEINSCR